MYSITWSAPFGEKRSDGWGCFSLPPIHRYVSTVAHREALTVTQLVPRGMQPQPQCTVKYACSAFCLISTSCSSCKEALQSKLAIDDNDLLKNLLKAELK